MKNVSVEEEHSSEEEELRFAPPGYVFFETLGRTQLTFCRPAYSGLTNNVSTRLQQLKGFPWKEGTPDFVNVRDKQQYIQSYSSHFSVEPLVRYNTRVERLRKVDGRWNVNSTTLIREGSNKGKQVNEEEEVSVDYEVFGQRLTSYRSSTQLWWLLDTIIARIFLIFRV